MTDDRDDEAPVIKVTDKRRFADLEAVEAGDTPASAADDDAPEREASGEVEEYLRAPAAPAGRVRQLPQARPARADDRR